ncbi:beta-glucuronidase-like [Phymastichus coffea]|uniref:beta-glucuronidase-like n=1 Tax=Phymastichus coffea TaxID=108790 RepID=UPI00273BCB6C|nr:beta-glucuronidase-like [Phymastichus coffea]XP_058802683.1 beta-glucuronidase-like [Phymastichus coffea]XP_058802684.1 beta-glucuronidase-like [Phymastichus coffea]
MSRMRWQIIWCLSLVSIGSINARRNDDEDPTTEARLATSTISEKSTQALPGLLYPRESESREVKSLDGFWDFALPPSDDAHKGHREKWFASRLSKVAEVMKMPVPSSYNDITTSRVLRDHVGPVWYERSFFVPASWRSKRVFVRFGSVNYLAEVWLNGKFIVRHEIGHLPFEAEITSTALYGEENRVTVAVDNTLVQTSVPQGSVVNASTDNGTVKLQTYTFDFFNYAGIHRPVLLHTKPDVFVEDITVSTGLDSAVGVLKYSVVIAGHSHENPFCQVNLLDKDSEHVVAGPLVGTEGTIKLASPRLWWPRFMSTETGYMYNLEVKVVGPNVTEPDIYRLPVGIRSLKWTNASFLINDKPIYFRGFGRHEDSAIRGRGLDLVTTARDYELLKWVGANSYRTSHYPYSDEVLDHADKMGFMIIDECPSANTDNFSTTLLKKHKQALSELIRRDKNRPSVVMWSIANEPRTQLPNAGGYFKKIAHHTKTLDPTRPITTSLNREVAEDKAGAYVDVISFNRYNGWYQNTGRLDMITNRVVKEAQSWHAKYEKPVLMSEYGADTMPGLHELPEYVWSEEYQMETMSRHFEAFDKLRAQGFFVGEFIWNFADFKTSQKYHRVDGNKKGIFTRDRQPKMAAHHVRKRYYALGKELDTKTVTPNDLKKYIFEYDVLFH